MDPNYAQAYAGMADCYILLSEYPYSPMYPTEGMPKAKAAVLKALELDDKLADAHNSLAYILAHYDWNYLEAEREFKRSIELNPNYPTAHQWYAEYLNAMGRFDESLAELRRAQELDPLSLIIGAVTSLTYYCERQYDQATEPLRKTLDLDPNFAIAHMFLSWVYERRGMYEQAVEEWLKFMSLSGESPQAVAALKRAYAERGWRGFLRGEVESLEIASRMRHVPPLQMVHLYASLEDKDRAFEWLEKGYRERNRFMIFLREDPRYDALRSDPRYSDLLRRINLG
jgi:tetratricopeptide (TPR) repeat protein